MKYLKIRYRLNDRQLSQLRPYIERQAGNLYRVMSKYRDRTEIVFCPFWMDTDIWLDLQIVRQEPRPNLVKSQQEALHAVYTTMEKEVLLILIDEQVLMLTEELELDSFQAEGIYNILARNLKKNQLLIQRPSPSVEVLDRQLKSICEETEAEIGKILLPEQLLKYRKSKQKILQDGVNLRGLAAAPGGNGVGLELYRSAE